MKSGIGNPGLAWELYGFVRDRAHLVSALLSSTHPKGFKTAARTPFITSAFQGAGKWY